jgi:predicted nucleic acid-binding protein
MNIRGLYACALIMLCINVADHPAVANQQRQDTLRFKIDPKLKVKYPCVDSLLQEMIADTQGIFQRPVFVAFFSYHGTRLFITERAMDTSIGAQTACHGLNKGYINDTILLNRLFFAANGSKEYLASLVIHEAMHAYINWCKVLFVAKEVGVDSSYLQARFPLTWDSLITGSLTDKKQHIIMSEDCIDTMITIMKRYTNDIGPAKKEILARSLAWGGLYATPKWIKVRTDCRLFVLEFLSRHMDLPKLQTVYPPEPCTPYIAAFREGFKLRPICD